MRRTKWAAAAMAVIALGAVSCGTSDSGTGGTGKAAAGGAAAQAPASPRPEGTGPLTKDVVRTDLDTSAAAAGLPANDPEYARIQQEAPADSPRSCSVAFKGFGSKAVPVNVARFDSVVGELRGRGWQESRERARRKVGNDGSVQLAGTAFKQRGWTLVAEYRTFTDEGVVTLMAIDDACAKQKGADGVPVV
ncbi:hypothetical protein ACWGDE_05685 [Streptomyces sp. NPDC054956]